MRPLQACLQMGEILYDPCYHKFVPFVFNILILAGQKDRIIEQET